VLWGKRGVYSTAQEAIFEKFFSVVLTFTHLAWVLGPCATRHQ
jgi:hypothetical protein